MFDWKNERKVDSSRRQMQLEVVHEDRTEGRQVCRVVLRPERLLHEPPQLDRGKCTVGGTSGRSEKTVTQQKQKELKVEK